MPELKQLLGTDSLLAIKDYVDTVNATKADKEDLEIFKITWSDLKSLRDSGNLVPGRFYRITDYTCTTTTANTSSAGHVFDVIVRANSVNKLNEEASAIQHEGDSYFANNKLEAWRIWYCLDNDTSSFDWADTTNGKGVIYRMIDEFNNDVPYDFKNMLFTYKGDIISDYGPYSSYIYKRAVSSDITGFYAWNCSTGPSGGTTIYTDTETPITSSKLYNQNGVEQSWKILYVKTPYSNSYTFHNTIYNSDASKSIGTHNNIIKSCYKLKNDYKYYLPFNVFRSNSSSSAYDNIIENNSYCNFFGKNTFGNHFGLGFKQNYFKESLIRNIFAQNCEENTSYQFALDDNIFGNDFSYNRFWSDYANIPALRDNQFKDGCRFNIFKQALLNSNFDQNCLNNTFGHATTPQLEPILRYINIDANCSYLNIRSLIQKSGSYMQNIHIHLGVKGTSSLLKTIEVGVDLEYETDVTTSGLIEYTPNGINYRSL